MPGLVALVWCSSTSKVAQQKNSEEGPGRFSLLLLDVVESSSKGSQARVDVPWALVLGGNIDV